jgi:hypothetical protein
MRLRVEKTLRCGEAAASREAGAAPERQWEGGRAAGVN